MNTPTHLLMGAALLSRNRSRWQGTTTSQRWFNALVLVGALVPDLGLFVLFVWARGILGVSEDQLWSEIYWQSNWQAAFTIGNSIPLFGLLFALGAVFRKHTGGLFLMGFAAAAFTHLTFDFPFHHDDAHAHFWPFTDWRFNSPLSYWDPAHHGEIVQIIEVVMAIVLMGVLWKRFPGHRILSAVLIVALISYIAVPIYFTMMMGLS